MGIQTIKEKLALLAGGEYSNSLHMPMIFNACMTEAQLALFEREHCVSLPEDYRLFLKEIGNGGFGPNRGLRALNLEAVNDPRFPRGRDIIAPPRDFEYQTAWNGNIHSTEEWSEKTKDDRFLEYYFSVERESGTLCICDLGCGCAALLVVKGAEYGMVWRDDRGSYGGLYPDSLPERGGSRLCFLEWYEAWLDEVIAGVPYGSRRMLGG